MLDSIKTVVSCNGIVICKQIWRMNYTNLENSENYHGRNVGTTWLTTCFNLSKNVFANNLNEMLDRDDKDKNMIVLE